MADVVIVTSVKGDYNQWRKKQGMIDIYQERVINRNITKVGKALIRKLFQLVHLTDFGSDSTLKEN